MIETQRLHIKEITYSDDVGFFEMCNDEYTAINAGWKPHANIDVTRSIISVCVYDRDTYSITLKDTNEFIGTISLYDNEHRDVINREMGFCLNKNFRKKGYMYEACCAMIKYAFEVKNVEILILEHATTNKDCEALVKKLPFKYEGCLRKKRKLFNDELCDCKSYSILKEEYKEEVK